MFSLMIEPLAVVLHSSPEVGALEVGNIKEYLADDMLLFLKDLGLSLRAALSIFDNFVKFSDLKVNWDKFIFLPLDSGTRATADPGLPL